MPSRRARCPLPVLAATVVQALAIAPVTTQSAPEPPTLTDVARVTDLERVGGYRFFLATAHDSQVIAWADATIERGTLDSAPVFVMRATGEIAELVRGDITPLAETALYTENLELIAARGVGGENVDRTYRWADDRLDVDDAHAKDAKPIEAPIRPTMPAEALAVLRGVTAFPDGNSVRVVSLDTTTGELRDETMTSDGVYELGDTDDEKVDVVKLTLSGPPQRDLYLSADGIAQLEIPVPPAVGVASDDSIRDLRRSLIANDGIVVAARNRLRKTWKRSGTRWSNADLGVSLRLPKSWKHATPDGTHEIFRAKGDDNALFVVATEPVADLYTVDEYLQLVAEQIDPKTLTEKPEIKPARVGRTPCKRMSMTLDYDSNVDVAVSVVIHEGTALRFIETVLPTQKKKFARDYRAILGSIEIR